MLKYENTWIVKNEMDMKKSIDSIKWIEDMEAVVVVLDATKNPYSQVNITIVGNLVARNIPVLVVANKIDLRKYGYLYLEYKFLYKKT